MPADRSLLERAARALFHPATEISHLRTGCFACTFKVADDRGVAALKIIDPGLSERERVERELNPLARVSDDGIVRFLEHGIFNFEGVDHCWIRMEVVDGRSLGHALPGRTTTAADPTHAHQVNGIPAPGYSTIWMIDRSGRYVSAASEWVSSRRCRGQDGSGTMCVCPQVILSVNRDLILQCRRSLFLRRPRLTSPRLMPAQRFAPTSMRSMKHSYGATPARNGRRWISCWARSRV